MDGSVLLTLCLGVLIVYFLKHKLFSGRHARLPPGPSGLPFLGNFLEIDGKAIHVKFSQWCKKFGGCMTVKLLGENIVVLQTADVIDKALLDPRFSDIFPGRAPCFPGDYIIPNDTIFQHLSKRGNFARKVMIRCMKNYSGKSEDNEILMNENRQEVLNTIESWCGKPFDPLKLSEHFTTRCMITALTGLRSAYTDKVQDLVTNIGKNLNYFSNQGNSFFLECLPLLRLLPTRVGKRYKRLMEDSSELSNILLKAAKKERPSEDAMLHHFLKEVESEEDCKGADVKFTMEALRDNITDLAGAGVETPTSLLYSLLYAVAYRQDVQKIIQQEIENSVGTSHSPRVSDKTQLPYTEATMMEVLRMAPPLRLSVPHCVMTDVEFNGYFLPKYTQVIINFWEPHHTEDFWEKPNEFDPTRFIDEYGQLYPASHEKIKRIYAFGAGKRVCPGKAFALTQTHIILATILQRYHLTLARDPTHDIRTVFHAPYNGIVFKVSPYKIRATER